MDLKLNGKIALVTGSSSGLGLATATLLAQEGANVVLNGRSSEKLNQAVKRVSEQNRGMVIGLPADLTEHAAAGLLVQQTVDHFGGLDILITNAGGPPSTKFENTSDEEWQKAVELNFLSQVRLIRAALPYLRKSASPSVLTVTSFSVRQPGALLILSNSVRLATIGLTKTLAVELGQEGIRFNSILPGWTDTDRVTHLMDSRAQASGASREDEKRKVAAEIPLGRLGSPEEFAAVAVFLVSPAASYMNGVMLQVDGGLIKGTL